MKSGRGTRYWPGEGKRVLYDGGWEKGVREGQGVAFYEGGGRLYEGAWRKNLFEGWGTSFYESGMRKYEGEFVKGVQEGEGEEFHFDTGEVKYKGEWWDGREFGTGMYFNRNGHALFSFDFIEGVVSHNREDGRMRERVSSEQPQEQSQEISDWVTVDK